MNDMKKLFKDLFGDVSAWGKLWLYLGVAALFAASWMSFMVGLKMTFAHAVFLVILSFGAAFLPVTAEFMWQQKRRVMSIMLALCSIPLLAIEFGQHAAYTAGIRGHDIETAKVQNTKWSGAQDDATKLSEQIAFWTKRRQSLIEQNGWTATVTADALRARMASLNLAIEQEAARGGCKAKCLERTRERDETASRIAVLEETNGLDTRIKQANEKLIALRDKANNTEHKSSQTVHMNQFLSKAVAYFGKGELSPDASTEEGTQLTANFAMALAGTGLPALCFFSAGLFRRKEGEHTPDEPVVARETVHAPATIPPIEQRFAPPPRSMAIRTQTIADLRSSLRQIAA